MMLDRQLIITQTSYYKALNVTSLIALDNDDDRVNACKLLKIVTSLLITVTY